MDRAGRPAAGAGRPAAKVAILHTCFVNYYNTGPGKALVKVLEKNGGDVALAQKQARANVESLWRLAVGEHLTLLFENGQTVWYQVEEMVRSERLKDEDAIRHEIDTYNQLLPRPGELTATMLLGYTDKAQRDAALRGLVGLERHFWIRIGERREPARFDTRQIATDRVSAVQFVRFPLGGLDQDEFLKFAADGKIAIEVNHPLLNARALITEAIAKALASDLSDT